MDELKDELNLPPELQEAFYAPDPSEDPFTDEEEKPGKDRYRCKNCHYTSEIKWTQLFPRRGCPKCGGFWNIKVLKGGREGPSKNSLASARFAKAREYIPTGVPELDRVLGGGLVRDCAVMLGGRRGVGKTTLLVQVANGFCAPGSKRRALYASGEENADAIIQVAKRLECFNENVEVTGNDGDIFKLVSRVEEEKFKMLIIDSLQTAHCDDVSGDVGQMTMIDAVTNQLTWFAKEHKVCVLIICHLNMQGEFAGSAKSQHLVDVMLRFDPFYHEDEFEGMDLLRVISTDGKNRLGDASLRSFLQMTPRGLQPPERYLRRKLTERKLIKLELVE